MASNEIPESPDPLCELGEDAADGAAVHAASIGIGITEAEIRAALENVVGAAILRRSRVRQAVCVGERPTLKHAKKL